jgi:hypothetical protein
MMRILVLFMVLAGTKALAQGVYQTPEAFVQESFGGSAPDPAVVWLTGEVRDGYVRIMGGAPEQLRLRYWRRDGRSVWVLEAIGKERPITAGFVVTDGGIERAKVLIFRESRGWEVRYPFFTDQFRSATLDGDGKLDRDIDGISGATLSVNAVEKMARLALFLHRQVVPGQ